MTRPRKENNGLPHRVYEYQGKLTYSIGYKAPDNSWTFRFKCACTDKREIQKLRRDAVRRVLAMTAEGHALETMNQLMTAWLDWQEKLPEKSTRKRADSTITENLREAKVLREVFGEMAIVDLQPVHAYGYLDKCEEIGRGPKANKEITLLKAMMNLAVRRGVLRANPLNDLEMLPVTPSSRYVEDEELELALDVGRKMGTPQHIVAVALQTAYLCVRRSVEVRDLRLQDIRPDGIVWENKKKSTADYQRKVLIEWSPALRSVIDEALSIERKSDHVGDYIFGTLEGKRYTKGGWKATLGRLMKACVQEAEKRGTAFRPFSLQDLRPKGVSDKLTANHTDVVDATLHTSERMTRQVYDRRRQRVAKPTK